MMALNRWTSTNRGADLPVYPTMVHHTPDSPFHARRFARAFYFRDGLFNGERKSLRRSRTLAAASKSDTPIRRALPGGRRWASGRNFAIRRAWRAAGRPAI